LFGKTVADIMVAGVFTSSIRTKHLWPAIIITLGVLIYIKFCTAIHDLLLGFVGVFCLILLALIFQRSFGNKEVT
jgi:hypothetical protein